MYLLKPDSRVASGEADNGATERHRQHREEEGDHGVCQSQEEAGDDEVAKTE